jgi:single-strand DNA-binding protein
MRGMSYVHMAGNVGQQPKFSTTPNGTPVAKVRLAVSRWDAKSEADVTDWWNVAVWGRSAEQATKILRPGTGVMFRGTPTIDEWVDNSGTKRRDVVVNADTFTVFRHAPRPDGSAMEPIPV